MSWTINGKKPSSLGVSVSTLREATLTPSELTLNVLVDYYASEPPADFVYDNTVDLRLDGQRMFIGKVKDPQVDGSGGSHAKNVTVLDAWDELDRLPYQQVRNFVTGVVTVNDHESSIVTLNPFKTGMVEWDADVPLDARIRDVISYAASEGVPIQVGNIIDGISWRRTDYQDMTCGEIIRDIIGLMPERSLWLDNRAATATMHMRKRSDIEAKTYDVKTGNGSDQNVVSHHVQQHLSEKVKGVILNYEKPVPVDTGNYTSLSQDMAGNTNGVDVLIQSVGLQSGNYQAEYASATCDDIPQEGDSDAEILDLWIKYTPELAAIADDHGLATVKALLKVADVDKPEDNIFKYKLKVVADGVPRPSPVNPNSEVVAQTENVADYRRLLIEGSIPAWAKKRFRLIRAKATLAVDKAALDNENNAGLKAQLSEIFNLQKSFGSTDYLTANFTGEMMGTNAMSGNYKRVVSSDLGEPVPVGIAAQLLAQLNTDRFSGSLTLVGDHSDMSVRVGQRLSCTSGDPAWATMGETIQSVTYELTTGYTTIDFGHDTDLGAIDFIERLRAARRNPYSHGLRSDKTVTEGTGGTGATPVFKFARVSGGGGEPSAECVLGDLIADTENAGKFKIRPGYVHGGGSQILLEKNAITPAISHKLFIEVDFTANSSNGVMLGSGSMNSAEIKQAGSVPGDDTITIDSLTGKHRRILGEWVDNGSGNPKWIKDGCGSYTFSFCRTFTGSRVAQSSSLPENPI